MTSLIVVKGFSQEVKRVDGVLYSVKNGTILNRINENIVTVKLKSKSDIVDKELIVLRSNRLGYVDIKVPENKDVVSYVSELKSSGKYELVKFAEIGKVFLSSNDPLSYYQWHLDAINVYDAWNITTGSSNIKVAVLDKEVYWNHQDIGYGFDNYKNIDESLGYNYIAGTNNAFSPHFHGTAVAGIIGAKTNNQLMVAGISGGNHNSGVTLIPYCVGSSNDILGIEFCFLDDAILDAIDCGARIINMSFGGMASDGFTDVDDAIEEAYQNGVTLIAATGNDALSSIGYPACHPKVIAIGGVGTNLNRYISSNYGAGLDIVAPGEQILTTTVSDAHTSVTGTSYAAPQASGVAALMLSVNPNLTPDEIRTILRKTAYKIPAYSSCFNSNGWCNEVGYGLLDAYAAVDMAQYYISGNDTLCQSDVYSVMALPSGATVTWTLSGSNAPKFNLVQDSPSTNKCTITKKANAVFGSSSFTLTLTANIYQGGTLIKTKTKTLTCYNGFACTYEQAAHSYYGVNYPAITQTQMTSATNYVYPGGTVSLQSNYFRGKEITASGTYDQFHHVYNQNVVTFSLPPYTSNPLIINVPASGCDDAVQLTFYPMSYYSMGSYSAILSVVSEQEYRISLVRNEQDSAEDTVDATRTTAENSETDGKVSWTVVAVNALTGRKVLSTEPEGTDYVLSTADWESGLYVLRVIVGGEVVATQKIHVR